MTFSFDNLLGFLMVFVRMTGMIAFNPVFSRRNLPASARAALILSITLLLAPAIAAQTANIPTDTLGLVVAMGQELFIGAVCGCVFLFFYYLIFAAGDILDTQLGLSMAKVFDPGSNIQASVNSNLLNLLFLLFFFATDSHLVLLRLFTSSYRLLPIGSAVVIGEIAPFMITLFSSVFSLVLRLALPFVAAEFVLEMSMGVLMKLIPQIHIFVLNIQFKILLGIFMLLTFSQPIANFIDSYLDMALQSVEQALVLLGG